MDYYYDWDDQQIEYVVWRCGGLTEAGKVLFGRLPYNRKTLVYPESTR